MAIDVRDRVFTLRTDGSAYQFKADKYGYLLHLYYGKKIEGSAEYLLAYRDRGFSMNPYDADRDKTYSLDALPQEYPFFGSGDFRIPALTLEDEAGTAGVDLRYVSHEIREGKYGLSGLPSVYAKEEEAQTLVVTLEDKALSLTVHLYYAVLPRLDVITRSAVIVNAGKEKIRLTRVYSASLDCLSGEYDVVHFHGRHGMERLPERVALGRSRFQIGSLRGTSSHQHNPFVILADRSCNEDSGDCRGLCLMYSGNFGCEAEVDQYGQTRIAMGIQSEYFSYPLSPGESFTAPEAVLCFSSEGFSALSHRFHRLIRHHVCRGSHKLKKRPLLINNWEATYFDFTGEKIISIAREAAALGVEMLVLDDGWFGKRDDDVAGLGDWVVNEKKLGMPLKELSRRLHSLGISFGLWIEPEMVNEDSDLFRLHPDWALRIPGRDPVRGRYQLVLDFSRTEVVDGIFEALSKVIDSAGISYIKMDMNRSINDVYSHGTADQNHGALLYRYTLGVYDFLERLLVRYPGLLIEGCSGGGGRFDAGMLFYTPQIWCSDNTDAIDRIAIQYGTSFAYPLSTVGAHVSAVPNHQTGRKTPLFTRGLVAMGGSFGYELDPGLLTPEEKEGVKKQIEEYHRFWEVCHNGDYYRLSDPLAGEEMAAWMSVREDGSEALVSVVRLRGGMGTPARYVRLKGLHPGAGYRIRLRGEAWEKEMHLTGSLLMEAGIPIWDGLREYDALWMHVERED